MKSSAVVIGGRSNLSSGVCSHAVANPSTWRMVTGCTRCTGVAAARDVDRVPHALANPRKHRSRQRVGRRHAQRPRLEAASRRPADDLTEEDDVTRRAESSPRVHTDDAGDAHAVARLLLGLARGGDRRVLAGLDSGRPEAPNPAATVGTGAALARAPRSRPGRLRPAIRRRRSTRHDAFMTKHERETRSAAR